MNENEYSPSYQTFQQKGGFRFLNMVVTVREYEPLSLLSLLLIHILISKVK